MIVHVIHLHDINEYALFWEYSLNLAIGVLYLSVSLLYRIRVAFLELQQWIYLNT